MKKRVLDLVGVALAVMMVLMSVLPIFSSSIISMNGFSSSISVKAINQSEVETKLNSLMEQYVGTTWNGDYYGIQCKGFANLIFYKLFGVTHIGPYVEPDKYYIASPSGATEVGRLDFSNMSQNGAKSLLQKGYPGDFIQVRRRGKTYGHSMILVASDENGITVFDCNSDGKNGVKKYYVTYSDFYSKNSAMSLYHAKNYDILDPWKEETSKWNVPITVTASKQITVYNYGGSVDSGHYISKGDKCYIDKVYLDTGNNVRYVHVKYPTSSGDRWAYAKLTDLPISSDPPSNVKLTINKTNFNLGDTITLTPSGKDVTYYHLAVRNKDGTVVYDNPKITGACSLKADSLSFGDYTVWVTAHNSIGYTDSNHITFSVKDYAVTIHYNTNGGTIAKDSEYYAESNGDIYKADTKKMAGSSWIVQCVNFQAFKNWIYISRMELTKNWWKSI